MESVSLRTPATSFARRRPDRRAGLHDLVREVAQEWVASHGRADLQGTLIDRVRRLANAQSVRLNELSSASTLRAARPSRGRDYLALFLQAKSVAEKL